MGIVPDVRAIRESTNKQKKASEKTKKRLGTIERYTLSNKDEVDDVTRDDEKRVFRHREADEKVLAQIRQQDLHELVARVDDTTDLEGAVIVEGDESLSQLKKQRFYEAVEENLGKEAILQAAEEEHQRLHCYSEQNIDSDGDLDVRKDHVGKKKHIQQLTQIDSDDDLIISKKDTSHDDSPPEVIYRDADGFKITREKWLELQAIKKGGYRIKKQEVDTKSSRSKNHREELQSSVEWGTGLTQKQEKEQREEEERRIMSQPLTRHEIDSTFDRELRETVRWDDPMRNAPSSRSMSEAKPQCRFPAPPNRFNIKPGYRWDGVIRGNGYEEKLLKSVNKKKLEEKDIAYKWSVEDL